MLKATKGMIIEYAVSLPPLALVFDFNPKTLSRTRTLSFNASKTSGAQGGYDFKLPTETPRVAQCVSVAPESFSFTILLDATDRMDEGDTVASRFGIEPELDTLRTMLEPKSHGPDGVQVLASLGAGDSKAHQRQESASVLLFVWGSHVLPVFLTNIKVDEQAHMPSLVPYRAEATLTLQIIESDNPFYSVEKIRQVIGAGMNPAQGVSPMIGGLF